MTEDTEQKISGEMKSELETVENAMPSIGETTWYPCTTGNPFLHLLTAAFAGLFSAIPVIAVVQGMGAESCSGAIVLFMAFFAIAIPHILSKFSFPDNVEKGFPHGVATSLLIGQVLAAYLFFMNTAFYGSTAFVTAVLIVIPVFGRLAMIWFLRYRHAWACTLIALFAFCWIFNLFQLDVMDLPLNAFLENVQWKNGSSGMGMAIVFLHKPILFALVSTAVCVFAFRKWENRKCAAMATAMITELAVWTAFLIVTQTLTFYPAY